MHWIGTYSQALLSFYREIAPLLLLGLLVAGLLHLLFPEYLIEKHLGGRGVRSVLKATFFGIPIPLCSCSVIPVVSSLKGKGASNGASVSFLVAAPQIGADSWMLTYGLLGPLFATFRIGAALVTALVAGLVENLLPEERRRKEAPVQQPTAPPMDADWRERARGVGSYVSHELLGSIANSLVLGMLLAALITVLVPDSLLAGMGADRPWLSMLFMLAVGIPLYVCATASTPIAAALLLKGISPGAALVFLLAGPATNAVTISTVTRSLGRRPAAIYLLSIATVSLAAGFLLDHFFMGQVRSQTMGHVHQFQPGLGHWLGGLVLGAMLLQHYALAWFPRRTDRISTGDPGVLQLQVDGMTCNHCVRRLSDSLRAALPQAELDVDLASGLVRLSSQQGWQRSQIDSAGQAVEQAGFRLVSNKEGVS